MQSYWTFQLFQGLFGHRFLPTLEGWVGPVGRKVGRKKVWVWGLGSEKQEALSDPRGLRFNGNP